MISLVSCTNRKNSISSKIAHFYQKILDEKNMDTFLIDLSLAMPHDFIVSALYGNIGKNRNFHPIMKQIKSSEKFVFVVPEYNGSFPGVFKTFIDGLEFPISFKDKKCALVGVSSGKQGASMAMSHLTDIFNHLGMNVFANKPKLSSIDDKIANAGVLDTAYANVLRHQATAFVDF